MPLTFGLAATTDSPALCDLLKILFGQEAEFVPNRAKQMAGVTAILADPKIGHILVARQAQNVIAMVTLLYTVSTALGATVAVLEDMIVAPQSRGTGVGTQLIQYAIDFAQAQGCKRITLLTDQSNDWAQRFYGNQGFHKSSMIPMRMML